MSQESSRLFQWAKTRLSVVLGLLMLTFGFLKFVSPTIDGWFHVQIQQSHLPHSAILMLRSLADQLAQLCVSQQGRPSVLPWLRRAKATES